jgi:hypothetical protein
MQPEERLDALLSRRLSEAMEDNTAEELASGTGELIPLLDAAEPLMIRDRAEPSSTFADQLEAALLSRFAASSDKGAANTYAHNGAEAATAEKEPLTAYASPSIQSEQSDVRQSGNRRRLIPRPASAPWRAVAALLLLGIGIIGGLATTARSGLLLNWSGHVTNATQTPDSVGTQLQQAQSALTLFNQSVSQRLGDQAYQSALARFAEAEAKVGADLAGLPANATRTALAAQLTALRERGRHDLRAALPVLSWSVRALVTSVLDQLGDTVPKIGQTTLVGAAGHDNYVWTITIQGSGFAPGAILLVDNQPAGMTVSVSATILVAQVSSAATKDGTYHVSVGNPDGTVAGGGVITLTKPDDHGGRGGGSGSGSGGSGSGSGGGGGS